MGTDDAELFSLFSTHLSIHSGPNLFNRGFDMLVKVRCNVKRLVAFQQTGRDRGSCLVKDIRKHIVQFDVGNGQAVLCAVFLPGGEIGQLPMVAHQIPKLPDVCRRDKAAGHQIVFENIGDPLGILLVSFLSPYRLDVLRVGQHDTTGGFQDVVNGYPILPGRFHAHILTVVLCQPSNVPAQIIGEGRKPFALVSCNTLLICRGDTRHDKSFVDIHPAVDRVNDFEYSTSPQKSI